MNEDYSRWFIGGGGPDSPVVVFALTVVGLAFILLGVATRNAMHVLRGAAAFGILGLIIVMFRPDLHGFTQFDTLAAKIFFGVLVSVIAGLIVVAITRR